MNSKEEIIKAYAHDYRDMAMDEASLDSMLFRCNNEIIETLIADIPDEIGFINVQGYDDTGYLKNLKQSLRDKWLI